VRGVRADLAGDEVAHDDAARAAVVPSTTRSSISVRGYIVIPPFAISFSIAW